MLLRLISGILQHLCVHITILFLIDLVAYFYHKLLGFFLTEKAGFDDETRRLIAKQADIEKAKEEEIHQNEQLEAQLREIHANNKALCAGRFPSFFLCAVYLLEVYLLFSHFCDVGICIIYSRGENE